MMMSYGASPASVEGPTVTTTVETSGFIQDITRLTESEAIAQGYTVIKTADDLNNIRNNLSGKYMLMDNIDLAGMNWDPIDNFTGTLDGNGFVIKNLTIDRADEDDVGLFGCTNDGTTIKNIGLVNVDIKGKNYVGALCGETSLDITSNSVLNNCYVTGTIVGQDYIGGLVGYTQNENISNCYTSIDITGNNYVGGLAGEIGYGEINTSHTTGNIAGYNSVGGVIGYLKKGNITNSYSTTSITGNSDNIGGICGHKANGCDSNVFFAGIFINSNGITGGIHGSSMSNEIKNSYWDTEKSGTTNIYGMKFGTTVSNVQGLTTAEMADPSNWAGWDSSIWDLSSAPPKLKGESNITSKTVTTVTGGVDVSTTPDEAFDGQLDGTIEFSNGQSIDISATDTRSEVLEKINGIDGMNATIGADGKIQISADGVSNLEITTDSSGFSQNYGLSTLPAPTPPVVNATLSGSVNISSIPDAPVSGQLDGTIEFSNGESVDILATDTRSEVIEKINGINGMVAEIDGGYIKITADGVTNLEITADSSNFSQNYGLSSLPLTIPPVVNATLGGTVNVSGIPDAPFSGQLDGTIEFSNGQSVDVSATDTRSEVLEKINGIDGMNATIGADGKIQISADGVSNLEITTDSSGFSQNYGLSTLPAPTPPVVNATLGGTVNVSGIPDAPFSGQLDGTIEFSNGQSINVSATDTRTEVLNKINGISGMTATVGGDGKISITADGVANLGVTSDSSGFTQNYGLSSLPMPTPPATPTPTPTPGGGATGGAGALDGLRLQVGANSNIDENAIFVDTKFELGAFSLDFSSAESCAAAINDIDFMINLVSSKMAEFGAVMNRLEGALQSQTIQIQNFTSAKSNILDADIAQESMDYVKNQILQQTSSALLKQAGSINASAIMNLIQGV